MKDNFKGELPSKHEIIATSSTSLEFDPNKLEFIVGNVVRKELISFSIIHNLDEFEGQINQLKEDISLNGPEMLLITSSGNFLETPNLRNWLSGLNPKEKEGVCQEAKIAIEKVFETIPPRFKIQKYMLNEQDKKSIRVSIYNNGIINMRTLEGYSFLPQLPQENPNRSFYKNKNSENSEMLDFFGAIEYVLENIDMPKHKLSLWAGMGAIAWMAKNNIRNGDSTVTPI